MKTTLEDLKSRRSIRSYRPEQIQPEELEAVLEAGSYAPTGMGMQSPVMVALQDRETIARLKTYKKHGTTPLETAPLAIVLLGDREKSDTWVEDASIAATLIQLEVVKLGLGSTWIQLRLREGDSGPSEDAFRKELGIPERYGVLNVVAIGHKAEEKAAYSEADLDFSKVHYEKF